jgi:hypothetical protein
VERADLKSRENSRWRGPATIAPLCFHEERPGNLREMDLKKYPWQQHGNELATTAAELGLARQEIARWQPRC